MEEGLTLIRRVAFSQLVFLSFAVAVFTFPLTTFAQSSNRYLLNETETALYGKGAFDDSFSMLKAGGAAPIDSPEIDGEETVQKETSPSESQNAEESQAERFFATPHISLGELIGGEDRIPEELSEEMEPEDIASEDEILIEDPFTRLLALDEDAVGSQKIRLFRRLQKEDQDRYLRMLKIRERKKFLRILGKEGRWFDEDFKSAETERTIEQFGYGFFTEAEKVAPEELGSVGPDYVVGPGDAFIIDVWGNFNGTFRVTVSRSGEIVLPKVGAIQVWGQSFSEARETIRQKIAKYYTGFEINVTLGELRSIQVYVVGEVLRPGTYTVSSLSTALNALHAAGGPAKSGTLRNLQLVRDGETVSRIDLYDFFLKGDRSRDVRLQSGDTIFVPVAGPLVGVAGEVRRPAIYELIDDETLSDLLDMTGGPTAMAAINDIQVERVDRMHGKIVLDLDPEKLGEGHSFFMQDRDLLKVPSLSLYASRYVRLAGYVARPGRFQWSEGLRVADLLDSDANLLPGYYPSMAEILRISPPYYRPQKITFSPELALAGDPEHNRSLQEFDEVRLFSRKEMEETPEVRVSGAVTNEGKYQLYEGMTVRDLILLAGNVRRFAYLSQAEITRFIPDGRQTRSERLLLDLEKALKGDPSNNILLQPEDHLFVRAIPNFSERQAVQIEGEVLFPGTYAITEGETLSSLLKRAGGYTPEAYLRGGVMTRQSVRSLQKKNIEKLLFEQEQAITQASLEMTTTAMSTEEVAAAKALLESRKAMVEKLRKVPVNGRMVINFLPLDQFAESEFDIPLMGDDTIMIPKSPGTVTVVGEVYNPISLVCRPKETVAYYIDRVGGVKESGEEDAMFIVRADGTVLSRSQGGLGLRWNSEGFRWEFGGFNTTELYPGDTILVPEKVATAAVMRNVKDISTIFYQMALGAAAVASF